MSRIVENMKEILNSISNSATKEIARKSLDLNKFAKIIENFYNKL